MILSALLALAADPGTVLRSDPARVSAAREGIEQLYARRYGDAKATFDGLTARYPTSGLGPLGLAILYQERMVENDDFAYEAPYASARDATRAQVEAGLAVPGDEALEHFVLAGVLGLDAIHLVRHDSYVTALARAYEALRSLERCKEAAPDFVDPKLGDGMFLFWRTVVAQRSPLIPDFADRRAEGIALMQQAEAGSVFLGPAASLALAVAWSEMNRDDKALAELDRLTRHYPGNVIVHLLRYEILLDAQRYPEAFAAIDAVDARQVPRAWFYRGVVLGRMGRWNEAAVAFRALVDSRPGDPEQVSQAWYRLGDALERAGDARGARVAYTEAANRGHKPARKALERPGG